MNRHVADNLALVDDRLRSIDTPVTRALLERWMLTFACEHTRFRLDEALLLGWQWAQRCGFETIATSGREPWCARPMPATAAEWAEDGGVVDPDTLPLVLVDGDGEVTEYHVLYDTVTVFEEQPEFVDLYPDLEPYYPDPQAHPYREFDEELTTRERIMLGHLWRIGATVEWTFPTAESVSQVEEGDPRPGRRFASRRLLIRPDADGSDVMMLVLRFLAETAWMMVLERHLGHEVDEPLAEVSTPLELGLVVEVTRRRVRAGARVANMDAHRFLREETALPAPENLRWWLIYEVAQLMEDLLLGEGPGDAWEDEEEAAETEEVEVEVEDEEEDTDDTDDTDDIYMDLISHLDRLMDDVPVDRESLAASWLRDFVCDNPRFSTEQAVALGWQLWERFGDMMAENPHLQGRTGDLELRTADEWMVRGRRVLADACPLYAPGTHGGVVEFLLSGDTEVVDTGAALLAVTLGSPDDSDYFHHHAPTEDTPELESLHGYVSDYELDLLRNATRIGVHVDLLDWDFYEPDDLEPWGDEEGEVTYLPVMVAEDRSVMRASMDRVMNVIMADLLVGIVDAEIIDGRFEADCSPLEEELAVLITAHRLGLEEEPILDEASDFFHADIAPSGVRWGLVYMAASLLDSVLRGYRWNSSD